MLTLCIDTSYKYLTCVLIKDDKIISSESYECFKKQSEELFDSINKILKNGNVEPKQIDSICISEGPGSYTGVRIAMTLAKTIGQVLPCDIYTISTLRLYASGKANTMVIMNARANRVYVGVYDKNNVVLDDCVIDIKDLDLKDYELVGDASLVGKQDIYPNIVEAFFATKSVWKKVDNISYLVPKYLKSNEEYLK